MPALIFKQYCEASFGTRFALSAKSVGSVVRSEQFIHFHLVGRKVIKVIAFEEQFNTRTIRQANKDPGSRQREKKSTFEPTNSLRNAGAGMARSLRSRLEKK